MVRSAFYDRGQRHCNAREMNTLLAGFVVYFGPRRSILKIRGRYWGTSPRALLLNRKERLVRDGPGTSINSSDSLAARPAEWSHELVWPA
jgi:hypothetical protein